MDTFGEYRPQPKSKRKVFVLSENRIARFVVEKAGYEVIVPDKDNKVDEASKAEADVIVCPIDTNQSLKSFKKTVKKFLLDAEGRLTIPTYVPVIFAYIDTTGDGESGSRIVEALHKFRDALLGIIRPILTKDRERQARKDNPYNDVLTKITPSDVALPIHFLVMELPINSKEGMEAFGQELWVRGQVSTKMREERGGSGALSRSSSTAGREIAGASNSNSFSSRSSSSSGMTDEDEDEDESAALPKKNEPVAPLVLFKYREQRLPRHSRQTRNEYIKNHLKFKTNDTEAIKNRKSFLLFAHDMSLRHSFLNIGHLKSTVSRSIEDELTEGLNYQHDRKSDRATIRGHKYDRVMREFKQLILDKFPVDERQDVEKFMMGLIDLLSCADTLERGFFNPPNKQQDIQKILDAAETAYWNKFERGPAAKIREVKNLPKTAQAKFDVLYNEVVAVVPRAIANN